MSNLSLPPHPPSPPGQAGVVPVRVPSQRPQPASPPYCRPHITQLQTGKWRITFFVVAITDIGGYLKKNKSKVVFLKKYIQI